MLMPTISLAREFLDRIVNNSDGAISAIRKLVDDPEPPGFRTRAAGHPVLSAGRPELDRSGEPYLDPSYRSMTVLPGTGQTVLQHGGEGTDVVVSRGHFMIRAAAGGLLLVNGVPHRGGGIRPPTNGTWLLAPVRRKLEPGEPYLIENGLAIAVWLPNGSYLQIEAS